MPNTGKAPIRRTFYFNKRYQMGFSQWDQHAVTITLKMEDDLEPSKKVYKTFESGFEYELPKENPFKSRGGYVFQGWSYTPNGPIITDEKITVESDITLYGVCKVVISLSPNEGKGDPVHLELSKGEEYTLPDVPPFVAPYSTFFDGWAYSAKGIRIEGTSIIATTPITLFPRWRTGYDGWVQLKNFNNPKQVSSLGTIYQEMSNITAYKHNGNYAFWNNIEMFAYEITEPVLDTNTLPEFARADAIYHLTTDNTYWHFEYNLIEKMGGLPGREDGLVWEELTLINLNTPRIADNTQEVYFNDVDGHCYYFDYINKNWLIQNNKEFGLLPNYTVEYSELQNVPKRTDHVREFYRITTTVQGFPHYCWGRLVDTEYHHPVRPRIDELAYWIIDTNWHLWVGNRPLLGVDILHQSDFETQTIYGHMSGPWQQYQAQITGVTILDDIVPVQLSHWFDVFTSCSSFEGAEHLKIDYCTDMDAAFAGHKVEKYYGLENMITENITTMSFVFSHELGGGGPKELDLSGWDTRKCLGFMQVFMDCDQLEHIYVGDNFVVAPESNTYRMFRNCSKLHNWDGTIDGTHAVIDDGTNGGYFERKQVITFEANGGAGEMKKQYQLKGSTYELPVCEFVSNFGLPFLGWSYKPDGEPLKGTIEIGNEDITLYAIWGKI